MATKQSHTQAHSTSDTHAHGAHGGHDHHEPGFWQKYASVAYLLLRGDIPLVVVAQRVTVGVDSFVLLAIPFFFLAGELMDRGGITQRLVDLAQALVGGIRGGLGHVTVVTNMIMAGMSGSAVADATGTETILIPAMERAGYPRTFSAALVGAASTIGPVIPPSIPFVIYGGITGVSVGRLFLGGVLPGVKMITTESGLVPDPLVHYVPADVLDPRGNGGATVLYYTGIRRLGREGVIPDQGHLRVSRFPTGGSTNGNADASESSASCPRRPDRGPLPCLQEWDCSVLEFP